MDFECEIDFPRVGRRCLCHRLSAGAGRRRRASTAGSLRSSTSPKKELASRRVGSSRASSNRPTMRSSAKISTASSSAGIPAPSSLFGYSARGSRRQVDHDFHSCRSAGRRAENSRAHPARRADRALRDGSPSARTAAALTFRSPCRRCGMSTASSSVHRRSPAISRRANAPRPSWRGAPTSRPRCIASPTGSIAPPRCNDIYEAALDAIVAALHCSRASILRCDDDGVMRFVAWRGLSDRYRDAVEGHSPWQAGETNPEPVCIADVARADLESPLRAAVKQEGIGALAFIPLMAEGKLVGKFMTYYDGAARIRSGRYRSCPDAGAPARLWHRAHARRAGAHHASKRSCARSAKNWRPKSSGGRWSGIGSGTSRRTCSPSPISRAISSA